MKNHRTITPQENKIRDYTHQRKNTYGENDKSSRSAIQKRKRWVNRSFRRIISKITNNCINIDVMEETINNTKRKNWKKIPNTLIIKTFNHKWSGSKFREKRHISLHKDEALRRLKQKKIPFDL